MIYIKKPSSLRVQYMIPQSTNEMKVVNRNFKNIIMNIYKLVSYCNEGLEKIISK